MSIHDDPHIFISYARKDKRWVEKLRKYLNDYPNIFVDTSNITTGKAIDPVIVDAINNSQVAICLVTLDFLKSEYIREKELPLIIGNVRSGKMVPIPILFKGCEESFPSSTLAAFNSLNAPDDCIVFPEDLDKYIEKLKLTIDAPPRPNAPHAPTSNLPAKPLWFVGYKKEKEDLKEFILGGEGLISVIGSPRVGKRTLVKQVAHELFADKQLPGGAIWVDCAKANDQRQLTSTVGQLYLKSNAPQDIRECQDSLEVEFSRNRALIILDNTENAQPDPIEDWAKKIPQPSSVVYIAFRPLIGIPNIPLRQLDPESAELLFRKVAARQTPDSDLSSRADISRIRDICSETRYHPLLIELYANECGKGNVLDDILRHARENRTNDVLTIWQQQLEPLFASLSEEHREAFLTLCRLPGGVSRELVKEITGIESDVLGPAIRREFLWVIGAHQCYQVDPSVKEFALHKLTKPLAEVDLKVAASFAGVAAAKAAVIEKSKVSEMVELERALNWFQSEWVNLCHCARVADQAHDAVTLCAIADSVLQFMINRGYFEDCLNLYDKALEVRKDDPAGKARTLNDKAVCLQFMKKLGPARNEIIRSIELQKNLIDCSDQRYLRGKAKFRLAQSWNTLGAIDLEDDKLENAAKAFETAEQLCHEGEKEDDIDYETKVEIDIEESQTLSNLGLCYTRQGQQKNLTKEVRSDFFQKAKDVFAKSLKIPRQGDCRVGQTYSRRGLLFLEMRPPMAKEDFKAAIEILQSVSNPSELGHAYRGMARVYALAGEYEEAAVHYKLAAEEYKSFFPKEQFRILMDLAKLAQEHQRYTEAKEFAQKAYEVARKRQLENGYEEEAFNFLSEC